ncbi:hypothetical protein Pmani_012481 [Petrolisthes manimaculis]|uniref:Uncharacterized protein n=1 Tax=Petrolisthes manimaculis TaxID=1843537 RepID=A0AAE1UAG4_9EUCA|nr:hypothetical protein Pmani_012481 [Petrolisthes manimaculis]
MDSGPYEFIEVMKHCSDYDMLEGERTRVKVEQCNDNEKLEDERMKVKIEDCTDDKFEEEKMKVKLEDCSDEDVIVKVEHDIDEDDKSKRCNDVVGLHVGEVGELPEATAPPEVADVRELMDFPPATRIDPATSAMINTGDPRAVASLIQDMREAYQAQRDAYQAQRETWKAIENYYKRKT